MSSTVLKPNPSYSEALTVNLELVMCAAISSTLRSSKSCTLAEQLSSAISACKAGVSPVLLWPIIFKVPGGFCSLEKALISHSKRLLELKRPR